MLYCLEETKQTKNVKSHISQSRYFIPVKINEGAKRSKKFQGHLQSKSKSFLGLSSVSCNFCILKDFEEEYS